MGAKTTKEMADWVYGTQYSDIDPDAIDYAKRLALSHLGMTLAGAMMPFGKLAIQYVEALNLAGDAGVIGGGFRTLPEYAALANGATSHTTELEDDSFPDGLYSCGVWPAAFAVGEKENASGKDVIEALILGVEVGSRLGVVAQQAIKRGWCNAPAIGCIGSAVIASKLMKLSAEQTAWAISLAASQAIGVARQAGYGAHLIEAGFGSRNGISAAKLAKMGYTGDPTILEGHAGWMDLWTGEPNFDLPLGEGWRIMDVGMKKYPCCYLQQRNIDGVRQLIKDYNIKWEDVEFVEHGINNTLGFILKCHQPMTAEDARFSVEHSTVAAFFDRDVFLPSYTDEKARDPKFVEARKKVRVTVHPEYAEGFCTEFDSPLTIKMKDGTEYKTVCVTAEGDPSRKLGPKEVTKKFMDCINFAGVLSSTRADKVVEKTLSMDNVKNVTEIVDLLTFPDSL